MEIDVGQIVTYTGKIGTHRVEFRGWFRDSWGDKLACVIFRIEGQCPFQSDAKPSELSI